MSGLKVFYIYIFLLKQELSELSSKLLFCFVVAIIGASTVTSLPHHRGGRSTVLQHGVHSGTPSQVELDDLKLSLLARRELDSPRCPTRPAPHDIIQPRKRSLCPWEYVTDSDINRLPEHVSHAVCKCDECNVNRLGRFPDAPDLGTSSGCREVYQTMFVLRRETPGDQSSPFVPSRIWVSVACVCQSL